MRYLLGLAFAAVALAQSGQPDLELIATDIANFWKAYDASQPGHREEAFQKIYLDAGSPGLKDFIQFRIRSAQALAAAVDRQYARFYSTVRPYTLEVESHRAEILKGAVRLRELYPEAKFPPVYFVIGRLSSGGTTSERSVIIGTEVNSLGPKVDTSEVTPSFRAAMGTPERLPLIVIHELTHTQSQEPNTRGVGGLLGGCVREGAADFMTELALGSSINAHVKQWAETRRDKLFQRLAKDRAANIDDYSQWMYNYSRVKDEPADLGYWIGAEICRSYYSQAQDKTKAIREIVTLRNITEIVRNSKYAWLLESKPAQ